MITNYFHVSQINANLSAEILIVATFDVNFVAARLNSKPLSDYADHLLKYVSYVSIMIYLSA